jgi:hypothetical protein
MISSGQPQGKEYHSTREESNGSQPACHRGNSGKLSRPHLPTQSKVGGTSSGKEGEHQQESGTEQRSARLLFKNALCLAGLAEWLRKGALLAYAAIDSTTLASPMPQVAPHANHAFDLEQAFENALDLVHRLDLHCCRNHGLL